LNRLTGKGLEGISWLVLLLHSAGTSSSERIAMAETENPVERVGHATGRSEVRRFTSSCNLPRRGSGTTRERTPWRLLALSIEASGSRRDPCPCLSCLPGFLQRSMVPSRIICRLPDMGKLTGRALQPKFESVEIVASKSGFKDSTDLFEIRSDLELLYGRRIERLFTKMARCSRVRWATRRSFSKLQVIQVLQPHPHPDAHYGGNQPSVLAVDHGRNRLRRAKMRRRP